MKKNKKKQKKMKKVNKNIITKKPSISLLLLAFLFFMFSDLSFAVDEHNEGNLNQEVRAIIQDSHVIDKEGSGDAKRIIESSTNVSDSYKSEVNQMINVSKDAMKEYQCKVSSDIIPENDLKDIHTGSSDGYYRYVFISTSMPKQALREIFGLATKKNALIVLRGFKNNSYLETQKHFSDLIRDTNTGFVVDPELFETYRINVVPSFVISKAIECDVQNQFGKEICSTPLHDKISGNISIDYAFDSLSKDGELELKSKVPGGEPR